MARYIDADALKRKLIDEKGFFPAIVADALDEMPYADVVPRAEVTKEIFAEIENLCGTNGYHLITTVAKFNELKKKYTEGK